MISFLKYNCNVTETYSIKYIVKTSTMHFIIKFAFNIKYFL